MKIIIKNFIHSFVQLLTALSTLGFFIIFAYWSMLAIHKYKSKPITSSVSYTYGDDGNGLIEFPTVTICLDSFHRLGLSQKGFFYNCDPSPPRFIDVLAYCIDSRMESTTEYSSIYEGLFDEGDYYADKFQKFTNLDDLINKAKFLEITDILVTFYFGNTIIVPHELDSESKAEILNKFWIPTMHYELGLCYTFEPKQHGLDKIPIVTDQSLLKIEMTFNVSGHLVDPDNLNLILAY